MAVRIAVLGDIHGNALALAAALDGAAREGVDALCLTGDYVGYYYHPKEVFALLAPWTKHMVRGNHEDMLARAENDASYLARCTARYGKGLGRALEMLDAGQLASLRALPTRLDLNLDGRQVVLAHGAPWSTDEYLYPDAPEEVWARVAAGGADFVLLGHTHYRHIRQVGDTTVINPGSVGQPRDRSPGACWALLDTGTGGVQLFVEPYDVAAVSDEARRLDPELAYLHEVLNRQ